MYRILYVDDEPSLLDIGKLFLEASGDFNVTTALSPPDGIRMLEQEQFDAIVSDYQMPGMDGIQFLMEVRKCFGQVPFILFTGRGREEVVIQALNSGADFYLQKGGEPDSQFAELSHKIRQAVQQKQASVRIRDHERRETDIINFLPDATFAIDTQGVVIAWNHAMEEMTGIKKEDMIGKGDHAYTIPFYGERRQQLLDLIDLDDAEIRSKYQYARKKENTLYAETFCPALYGGKGAYVWATGSPLFDARGDRIGAIESIRDITERKRAEEVLTKSRHQLAEAMDLAHLVNWELDVGTGIFTFDDRFYALFGTTAVREGGYQMKAETYAREFLHPDDQHLVAGEVKKNLETTDPHYQSTIEHRIIRRDGEVRWVQVRIGITKDAKGRTIKTHGANQNITDLKRAEETMRESENKYRSIVEQSLMGIGISKGNQVLFANRALLRIFNYEDLEEFKKIPLIDHVAPSSYQFITDRMKMFAEGKLPFSEIEFEYDIICKGGLTKTLHAASTHVSFEGGVYAQTIFQDITERKRAEEALRESEERYCSILENIQDVYYRSDTAGNFLMVSPSITPLLGYNTVSELLGKNIAESVYYNPEERSKFLDELNSRGSVTDYEVTLKKRNGTPVYVSTSSHKYYDDSGNYLGVEGVFRDITEQKRIEDALQESEEKYRRIVETANEGVWVVDQNMNTTFVNQRFADMLGYSREEIVGHNVMDYIITDDKAVMEAQFDARRNGTKGRYECKFRHRDGRVVWCLISGSPLTDDTGAFKGSFGMILDITDRKMAVEALQNSEVKYRMLFESSQDALMTLEPLSFRFSSCNSATLQMFDLQDEAEFISLGPWDISPATQPDGQLSKEKTREMIDIALRTGSHIFEWTHLRYNGETFPCTVLLSKMTIGEKTVLQASVRDITNLKKTEDRIAQQSRNLSILNELITTANKAEDLTTLLNVFVDTTLRLLEYDGGGIYLVDAGNKTASVVCAKNLPEDFLARVRTVDTSKKPYDTLFVRGEPLVTDKSGEVSPALVLSGFCSVASIPLVARGNIIGALNVASRKRDIVTDQELSILLSMGKELGTTIFRLTAEGERLKKNEELSAANEQIAAAEEELRANLDELTRQERALRESKKELADIIEFLPDATFAINTNGVIIAWNHAMEVMTGVKKEDMLNKGNHEYSLPIYHERRPILIDLVFGYDDSVAEKYQEIRKDGDRLIAEIFTPHLHNGRGGHLWFTSSPLYDSGGTITGAIESIREITEHKERESALNQRNEELSAAFEEITSTEEELRQQVGEIAAAHLALHEINAYLNNLFDYANAPIIVWNPEYVITRFNHAFEDLTLRSEQEVIGQRLDILFPEESRDISLLQIKKTLEGERWETVEIPILVKDGSVRTVLWNSANVLDPDGWIISTIAQGVDITDRKVAEEALIQANKKLTLLSGISLHDINNQLTGLRGYLTLLEKKQTDPSFTEYFQNINAAAQRISTIIRFTKEYDKIAINSPAWQNCRNLIDTAAKQAPLGKIVVKNDLPEGTEVFADPLVVKVCNNLMDNAARYGGKITTIRFTVEKCDGDHVVVCEDDGDGVVAEEKEKIFELGFGKNTGLGLALSREILDISGITIRETGEPGKGARFEITVPKGMWRIGDVK